MLNGPFDVGGSCPSPTYKDNEIYCCCREDCCWSKCNLASPPEDCLKNVVNSQWVYNYEVGYYMAIQNWTGNKSVGIFDQKQWVKSGTLF